jgi:hypothetical protein
MHRLRGPELYHFYLGDPVEQLMLREDGAEVVHLGPDLAAGQRVQHVVPGGVWQGSRLRPGGRYALMGTTMAPGFDLADFTLGRRDQLLPRCPPEHAALLTALTPTRLTTPHLELAAATRDLLHAELRGPTFLAAGLGGGRARALVGGGRAGRLAGGAGGPGPRRRPARVAELLRAGARG